MNQARQTINNINQQILDASQAMPIIKSPRETSENRNNFNKNSSNVNKNFKV